MKVQRIAGAFCRIWIWNVNHLYVYFCGIRPSLIFFRRRGVTPRLKHPYVYTENVIFPCNFWERPPLPFCPGKRYHVFEKKTTIFSDNTRKMMCWHSHIWKDHLFRKFEESIFPCIFWARSSFIFRLRHKILFSRKRYIIFPNNARKIIFQRKFFGKTIFSGHLEKGNMVFRPVTIWMPWRSHRKVHTSSIPIKK